MRQQEKETYMEEYRKMLRRKRQETGREGSMKRRRQEKKETEKEEESNERRRRRLETCRERDRKRKRREEEEAGREGDRKKRRQETALKMKTWSGEWEGKEGGNNLVIGRIYLTLYCTVTVMLAQCPNVGFTTSHQDTTAENS